MTTEVSSELPKSVRTALDQFLASEIERKGVPGVATTTNRNEATHVLDVHISHVQVEELGVEQAGAAADHSSIALGLVASAQLVNLATGKAERHSVKTGEWPAFVFSGAGAPSTRSPDARAEHREKLLRFGLTAFGLDVLFDLGLIQN